MKIELDKDLNLEEMEARCRALWEDSKIYEYQADAEGEIFSIDTPPPYVSAAHLHVGHAMSYAQAEFVVRYHRMNGKKIFYPMGFDDNGLPTERFVEKKYNINKRKTTRKDFRALCLEETREGIKSYKELWRSLGLSVDWSLEYSTINEHCCRTSQKSFIDLFKKGRLYRSAEPVLWDPHFETALAQADLETLERKTKLYDIAFSAPDGQELIISTTRPSLLPACVALYCNPNDSRYQHLIGSQATVPYFGHQVPIKADEDVLMDFGTGLMMVCTFGDGEDVHRWKRDGLALRHCITSDGKLTELAGKFAGIKVNEATNQIVKALEEVGAFKGFKMIDQRYSVSERSGEPVEFFMTPQWFIKVLDIKDELLARSAEINWNPASMKVRLDTWIDGLKYDWNISRQRFYGVPFPIWFCQDCKGVILAEEQHLPVDPAEEPCPVDHCPHCGGNRFEGESDVMDTWMTSSLSPLINGNWAGSDGRKGDMSLYPMSVRVQAFEIIRTWLFYTVVKSHLHHAQLPWEDVMISGWGLNEQGKKISKRDLEQFTDASGYNRYEPYAVIKKHGADALRYWAAGSHLGSDMKYNEKDVSVGRKLVVKLWNASRFVLMQLGDFDPTAPRMPADQRVLEDRWLLSQLNQIIQPVINGFEKYDYAQGREQIDRFFWMTFCDDYLEMVKDRFWNPDRYSEEMRQSARETLWESLRVLLGLYAPYLPFITEELFQKIYRPFENHVSLHVTRFPKPNHNLIVQTPEIETAQALLRGMRSARSDMRISQTRQVKALILDLSGASDEIKAHLKAVERSIQAMARAGALIYAQEAQYEVEDLKGLRLSIVPEEDTPSN